MVDIIHRDSEGGEFRSEMPVIPEIYINGFNLGAGQSDVVMVLNRNGKDIYTVNMSYTLAKTLAKGLSDIVRNVEEKAGMNIKTTHEISSSLGMENVNESNT